MIYLYLKTHNITGLKYLGKTNKKDPHKYQGSGKRWKRHINKHGYNVTTEILAESLCKLEIKELGIGYSILWNIVESKEFANLMIENCEGGGCFGKLNGMYGKTHTDKVKFILSENAKRNKGKTYEEMYGLEKAIKVKKDRSNTFKCNDHKGKNNSRYIETKYIFYNIETKETFIGDRYSFYTKYNLPKTSVHRMIHNNISCRNWKLLN